MRQYAFARCMLAVEIASFMAVVPIWEVLKVHTWVYGICNRGVILQMFLCLHIVTAISPFLCFLYLFTVAGPWCFRSPVIASAPTGCYFQLFSHIS